MDEAKTVWVGNIGDQVTEQLLYEIFLQAGPLERVTVRSHQGGTGFGFVTFKHEDSVPYAVQLFEDLQLFGLNLSIKPRTGGGQSRQNSMRRSGGGAYQNTPQSKTHQRFESMDLAKQLEDLEKLGQQMNVGYSDYPESYDESGGYSDISNGRNMIVDEDRERSYRHFDRPTHGKQPRNNQRTHHKRDNYNRNRGRRHPLY